MIVEMTKNVRTSECDGLLASIRLQLSFSSCINGKLWFLTIPILVLHIRCGEEVRGFSLYSQRGEA